MRGQVIRQEGSNSERRLAPGPALTDCLGSAGVRGQCRARFDLVPDNLGQVEPAKLYRAHPDLVMVADEHGGASRRTRSAQRAWRA